MEKNQGFRIGDEIIPEEVIQEALMIRGASTQPVSVAGRALDAIISDDRTPEGIRNYLRDCLSPQIGVELPSDLPSIEARQPFWGLIEELRRRAEEILKKPAHPSATLSDGMSA